MSGEQLRKLATEVRNEAARQTAEKNAKCAQIIKAATGLEVLRRKLGVNL